MYEPWEQYIEPHVCENNQTRNKACISRTFTSMVSEVGDASCMHAGINL